MNISKFQISNDKTELQVVIDDAADLQVLRFWDDSNYRDFSKAEDFSSKITGDTTLIFNILLSELTDDEFDGIYFLEAEDTDETSLAFDYTYTKYKECILDKVLELSVCDDCLKEESIDIINSQTLLDALTYASEERFIDEMLMAKKALDKYCDNDCKTCGGTVTVTSTDTSDTNFEGIVVKIDGQSLD